MNHMIPIQFTHCGRKRERGREASVASTASKRRTNCREQHVTPILGGHISFSCEHVYPQIIGRSSDSSAHSEGNIAVAATLPNIAINSVAHKLNM